MNLRPLESEATTLPTEPQPLLWLLKYSYHICLTKRNNQFTFKLNNKCNFIFIVKFCKQFFRNFIIVTSGPINLCKLLLDDFTQLYKMNQLLETQIQEQNYCKILMQNLIIFHQINLAYKKCDQMLQSCPNSSNSSFSKLPKKSPKIWATFVRKLVGKRYQKSSNLVTLLITHRNYRQLRIHKMRQ